LTNLVIGSTREGAGKTSIIVGIAEALRPRFGYIKPFGDRLMTHRNKVWDYDASLMVDLFDLDETLDEVSIDLQHSKVRYTSDRDMMKGKLLEMCTKAGKGRDHVFVEGGKDLAYGTSVHLDTFSFARWLKGPFVVVGSGHENTLMDDISFIKRHVDHTAIDLRGVIFNKVAEPDNFKDDHLDRISSMGIETLGVIPHEAELTHLSVRLLVDVLFAKVQAGASGLDGIVKTIFAGDMSSHAARQSPFFEEGSKLVITSGDRTDMVLAALDSDTAAVLMTNNIPPPPSLISVADDRGIPLLMVPQDTFQAAKHLDTLEPLLTKEDPSRVELLGQLVEQHVDLTGLMGE
jgi:BioD-like phosphotransacetylase family protein